MIDARILRDEKIKMEEEEEKKKVEEEEEKLKEWLEFDPFKAAEEI